MPEQTPVLDDHFSPVDEALLRLIDRVPTPAVLLVIIAIIVAMGAAYASR